MIVVEGKAVPVMPIPGLPTGHQLSLEERKLIVLHPAIADIIREPTLIRDGASWESFNWVIVELETNVFLYSVLGL